MLEIMRRILTKRYHKIRERITGCSPVATLIIVKMRDFKFEFEIDKIGIEIFTISDAASKRLKKKEEGIVDYDGGNLPKNSQEVKKKQGKDQCIVMWFPKTGGGLIGRRTQSFVILKEEIAHVRFGISLESHVHMHVQPSNSTSSNLWNIKTFIL